MRFNQSPFVSLALIRLRKGVTVCCWTAAAALVIQVLVWAMATFTEARHIRLPEQPEASEIVTGADAPRAAAVVVVHKKGESATAAGPASAKGVDPNRVFSRFDAMLALAASFSLVAGTIAIVLLIQLLALGVLLGVSSSVSGVDDAVAAFMWCAGMLVVALPVGHFIGLPWRDGAMTTYVLMTQAVDAALGPARDSWGSPVFYARYAFLPLTCVAMLAVIGWRFNSGVQAGIAREDIRLDPVLEKEAAGVRAGSLHGGRAGSAMRTAGLAAAAEPHIEDRPITQVSGGAPLRRLI